MRSSPCRTVWLTTLSVLLLTALWPQPPLARQWRTTPQAEAQEYAAITDQRGPGEVVVLLWISPQLLFENAASQQAREVLSKYLVLGIAHADTGTDGSPSFRKVPRVAIEPNNAPLRESLDEAVLPPVVLGAITSFQAVVQQMLGPFGRGIRWFVFDGADVPSCGRGGFAVPYDGVRYTYETPIPGCPKA